MTGFGVETTWWHFSFNVPWSTDYSNFLCSFSVKSEPSISEFILPLTLQRVHMRNLDNLHSPCKGISLCCGSHISKPLNTAYHLSWHGLSPHPLQQVWAKYQGPSTCGNTLSITILTSTSSTAELSCNPPLVSHKSNFSFLTHQTHKTWNVLPALCRAHLHLFRLRMDYTDKVISSRINWMFLHTKTQVFRYDLHTLKSIRQKFMSFPYFLLFIQQKSWQC